MVVGFIHALYNVRRGELWGGGGGRCVALAARLWRLQVPVLTIRKRVLRFHEYSAGLRAGVIL
jgi:hypothetical protein